MTDEKYRSFEIDFGANGGSYKFRSSDELRTFISEETGFWSFLEQAQEMGLPDEYRSFANTLLRRIGTTARQVYAALDASNDAAQIIRPLQELFYLAPGANTAQGKVPLSRTPKAQFLADAFTRLGAIGCLAAISTETNTTIPNGFTNNPVALKGINAYFNFLSGISQVEPDAIRDAIEINAKEYRQRYEADAAQFNDLKQRSNNLLERSERLRLLTAKWTKHRWNRKNAALRIELDQHLDAFKKTEETYKTFMKLKAPAEYWEQKADGHDDRTIIFGLISTLWAAVAGGALFFFIQSIFDKAVGLTTLETANGTIVPLNSSVLLILGAQGLIASTIVFWVARVLVRLFLSELHLAMDARERTTMVQCYLALSEEGEVEESSLHIVLQSLFRPTQDGIVKDDASSDLTPSGILSRILSK